MIDRLSDLADKLIPLLLDRLGGNFAAVGTGAGELPTHALFSAYHTGTLAESQAPWVDAHITNAIAQFKPHNITDALYHAVTGAQYGVVGLPSANALGILESSDNPGAAIRLLRSTAEGGLTINTLTAASKVSTPLIDHSGGYVGVFTASPAYPLDVTGDTRITGDHLVTETATIDGGVITPSIDTATGNLSLSASNNIMVQPDGSQMRMANNVLMQTDNYVSQLAGWRHTYYGELDTRYIYADQLKIKLFIADLEQALAGSQVISKSVTTIAQDFIAPYPGATLPLYVDDLPSAEGMQVFESGDIIRLRKYSRADGSLAVSDCWGTVSSYSDQADKVQRWSFTRLGSAAINTISNVGANQTASSASTTSSIVTKVSGTASGHYMLAQVVLSNTAATITPPADWYVMADATVPGLRMVLYYKIAGGSEPANYTWSYDATTAAVVTLRCLSNVEVDYSVQVNLSTSATTSMIGLSNLSLSNGDYYLFFGGIAGDIRVAPPGGFTEDADLGVTGIGAFSAFDLRDTAGDYGDATATLASAAAWISVTVDLLPTYLSGNLDLTSGYMSPGSIVAPDSIVLDYGVSGNGWHEITAVDGAYGSNSPYSRVVSWEGHPVTGAVVRTQDGNLNGIFGDGPEWGFYAGDGAADTDAYLRLSNIDSRFNNIALGMFHDGERRFLLTPSSGVDIQAPSSFLGDFHSINFSPIVGSGNSYGRIYNLVTNAGLNDQVSTLYLEAVATGLLSEQQAEVALLASGGGGALETGEISITVDHNGGDTLGVATIKAPTSIEMKTLNTLRAIVTSDGYVGIGTADPYANLQVARGAGPNGTAVFMGTEFASHFSYATDEHTYIRGGKSTSKVVINDTSSGPVEIAAGGGATTFGGILGTAWAGLSFGSGWGNLGGGWQTGQYKKIGDIVMLRGFVVRTSGTSARIATLPSGYRPLAPDRWAVTSDAGLHATIQVDADGNIDVVIGSPDDYMTLSGIIFSTAS